MGKKNKSKNLSHEEIWDDSALVRSWDEAVEEYKLYHSIHARGENVEEVLGRAEAEGLDGTNEDGPEYDEDPMDTGNTGSRAALATDLNSSVNTQPTRQIDGASQYTASDSNINKNRLNEPDPGAALPFATGAGPANVPSAMLGPVHDPALKNLMMAWYYAGYYTGLYEGQQRVTQNAQFGNSS